MNNGALLFKKYKNPIITIIFFAFAAWYIRKQDDGLALLSNISILHVAVLAILHFIAVWLNSMFSGLVVRSSGHETKDSILLYGTVVGALGNFFLPVGAGTLLKASVYKKHFKFSYSYSLSLVAINYLLVFFLSSIVGIVSIAAIAGGLDASTRALWLVSFGVVATASFFFLIFSAKAVRCLRLALRYVNIHRFDQVVSNFENGWKIMKQHPSLRLVLPLLVLINYIVVVVLNVVAFAAIGVSIDLYAAILFAAVNTVSLVFNITPGSIGIKEGLYIAAATAFNIGAVAIVAAALIDRLVRFLLLAVMLLVLRADAEVKSK